MPGPRLNIAGLLGLVLGLGFSLAALKVASEPWLFAAQLLALVVPLTAIVGILFRRGRSRAFWAGVAVFGWGSILLLEPSRLAVDLSDPLMRLAERVFVEVAVPDLPEPYAPSPDPMYAPPAAPPQPADLKEIERRRDEAFNHNREARSRQVHFIFIAAALLTVALALLGGLVARGFADRTAAEARARSVGGGIAPVGGGP